jgi:hypothetical protein
MAVVPTNYLDAVVVIERGEMTGDEMQFSPMATGTLLGYLAPDQTGASEDEEIHAIFLVTNRHVIDGLDEIWLRFNQGAGSGRFRVAVKDDNGDQAFMISEHFDLAVIGINAPALNESGAEFSAIPQKAFLDLVGIEDADVSGGEGVFVLGFPMGITGTERKYAIVRGGVIARLDREIIEETGGYLIDCAVFPGNSGGPVILRPELMTIEGTPGRDRSFLIGIVSAYLPYIETAVSDQTGRPRITFEENSGLANVVPLDVVHQLVKPLMDELRRVQQLTLDTDDGGAAGGDEA